MYVYVYIYMNMWDHLSNPWHRTTIHEISLNNTDIIVKCDVSGGICHLHFGY